MPEGYKDSAHEVTDTNYRILVAYLRLPPHPEKTQLETIFSAA